MSKKERTLPKPPAKAFGPRRRGEEKDSDALMADRIAGAMSEGKLNEFLENELPDSEYSGKLVSLMMGMTGMLPPECHEARTPGQETQVATPPADLLKAVQEGDTNGIKTILKREHDKRSGEPEQPPAVEASMPPEFSTDEKETLDRVMKIASENQVSVDWIILRALKLYIGDYIKTGRL